MTARFRIPLVVMVVLIVMLLATRPANAAVASCYGPGLWGNPMASGAPLNQGSVALAHRTLPFGTRIMVRDLRTKRARMMVVRDRGPYAHGRTLDISEAGVRLLGSSSCRTFGVRVVATWRYPYRSAR